MLVAHVAQVEDLQIRLYRYTSTTSRLHLGCISAASRLHLAQVDDLQIRAGVNLPRAVAPPPPTPSSDGLSAGAMAGVVVGAVVGLCLLCCCCLCRTGASKPAGDQTKPADPEDTAVPVLMGLAVGIPVVQSLQTKSREAIEAVRRLSSKGGPGKTAPPTYAAAVHEASAHEEARPPLYPHVERL